MGLRRGRTAAAGADFTSYAVTEKTIREDARLIDCFKPPTARFAGG
jgi:hypothetical protein